MPKINQLPSASSVTATDLFAIDNSSGTATKHVSGQQIKDFVTADVNAEVTDLKNAIIEYGTIDIISDDLRKNATSSGVTYTWNSDKTVLTVTSNGSASSGVGWDQLYSSQTVLPNGLIPGEKYYAKFSSTGTKVAFYIYSYVGSTSSLLVDRSYKDAEFTFPSNATGVIIRIWVAGSTNVNEDVRFSIYNKNALALKTDSLTSDVQEFNSYDIITDSMKSNAAMSELTWIWNTDRTACHVSGTSSAVSWNNIWYQQNSVPDGIESGKKYYLKFSSTGNNVAAYVQAYASGEWTTLVDRSYTDAAFTVPASTTGFLIRIWVPASTTVNETVTINILNAESNDALTEYGRASIDAFNGEPFPGTYDWETPAKKYCKLFYGKEKVETFAFFTDPHILGYADGTPYAETMHNYLKKVQNTYNNTPCSFIVCGGDLLNNSTTIDEACYRLGNVKGAFDHLLDGCYLVIGNHDTNYYGKETSASADNTGRIDDNTLAAILYRDTETKKAYYSFDGAYAKCYVLDTGDVYDKGHSSMLAYDWEQVEWLAGKLAQDDPAHAIIFLHIVLDDQVNTQNFASLVQAYNSHTSVTLNGSTYNFSGKTGHVDFWMTGHNHSDANGTLGGIPYIRTASIVPATGVPIIDLVLVDYDDSTIDLIRVGGTGSDRNISF